MNKWRKVDEIITYFGKGVTPKYVDKSSVIVLNQKCIRNNHIDYSLAQFIDDNKDYSEIKYLRIGDVLVNSTGQGTAGRVAFVDFIPEGKKVIVDSHILVLRTGSFYESKCLNYSLFSIENTLQTYIDGSTGQGEFDRVRLFNVQVNYPEKENDQRKIASVLSALDDRIELNNRINVELEAMAKLIYEYWFVQFDFPVVTSSGVEKPYKSSGGKMIWNKELKREIPEGWKSGYLSDLGKIIGGSTPSRDNPDFFSTCGIPWITPKDLSNNVGNKFIFKGELDISEKGKESASLKIMPRGTILMSSRAPIGYLAISVLDVTTNQGFKSFIPEEPFTTEFIYYKLNEMMPVIENNASGSTFKEVSASTLRGIKIVMPSSKIIDAYTLKVAPLFEKQENIQKQNQELASLRDWLLPMLMNGQVTVADVEEMVEEKLGMVAEEWVKYRVK